MNNRGDNTYKVLQTYEKKWNNYQTLLSIYSNKEREKIQ